MCGIAGYLDKSNNVQAPVGQIIFKMLNALGRRGPAPCSPAQHRVQRRAGQRAARSAVVPPARARQRAAARHSAGYAPVHPALADGGHGGRVCQRTPCMADARQPRVERLQPPGMAGSEGPRPSGCSAAAARAHGQPAGRGRGAVLGVGRTG